jgi:hypothetical protein
MVTTNNDTGAIEVRYAQFADARLLFAAAGTIRAGTILARPTEVPVIDEEVTVTPDGGNTGDGTVTAIVVGSAAKVGTYVLTCTAEAANGGTFSLVDPDAETVSAALVMTAGSGASTVFTVGGLQITVTDGAADFDIGDTLDLVVATTGEASTEFVAPFEVGGSDGYGTPKFVLQYDVTSAVENVVTVTADGANTGDGEITATIVDDSDLILGPYVLECTAEVANGGVFSLTDPEGTEIADDITMTPGSLGQTVILSGPFRIVINDGAADFDTGDLITISVREQFVAKPVRPICEGEVNRDRLIIHADGDDSNLTAAHLDSLRSFGIVASPVQQLGAYDN